MNGARENLPRPASVLTFRPLNGVTDDPISHASFLPIFSFLRPLVLDLRSRTGQTDRQTDRRTDRQWPSTHYAPSYGGGA